MTSLSVGIQPEYVAEVFGVYLTNSFLTTLLVTLLVGGGAILFSFARHKRNVFTESLRVFVYELLRFADLVTKDRELSKRVLPLLAAFFLFIVTANLLGLVPGFLGSLYVLTPEGARVPLLRSPNSDLTTTLALALVSVVAIQWFSIRTLGLRGYLSRFFNFANPARLFLGFFELLSEGVKILSFSFRLFGNVFAGEVLLLVAAFVAPYFIPLPFMLLEVFVGVVQAFVFTALTLTFIRMSSAYRAVGGHSGHPSR